MASRHLSPFLTACQFNELVFTSPCVCVTSRQTSESPSSGSMETQWFVSLGFHRSEAISSRRLPPSSVREHVPIPHAHGSDVTTDELAILLRGRDARASVLSFGPVESFEIKTVLRLAAVSENRSVPSR